MNDSVLQLYEVLSKEAHLAQNPDVLCQVYLLFECFSHQNQLKLRTLQMTYFLLE